MNTHRLAFASPAMSCMTLISMCSLFLISHEGPTIWAIPTCHKSQHCNHDKVSESLSTHPAISSKSSILDSDSIQDDSIFVFAIENPCRAKGASTQCGSSLPDNLAEIWWLAVHFFPRGYSGVSELLRGLRSINMVLCTVCSFEPILVTSAHGFPSTKRET